MHDPVIGVEWHVEHPSLAWPWTNGIDEWASSVSAVGVFFNCTDMLSPSVNTIQHNTSNPIFLDVN